MDNNFAKTSKLAKQRNITTRKMTVQNITLENHCADMEHFSKTNQHNSLNKAI